MIHIDADCGEGGGQILRVALAVSAVRGVPVHLRGVRARRRSPGLQAQHLTAVSALAHMCAAQVSGVALGFNISFTLFSGTAPLVATWLIGRTGSNVAPALILGVCGLITLVASFLHPKYSGHVLHHDA